MNKEFFKGNRERMYDQMKERSLLCSFQEWK